MLNICSPNMNSTFDETAWRLFCEKTAEQVDKRCDSSHDYYIDMFGMAIDTVIKQFNGEVRKTAIAIATEWHYATEAQRIQQQEDLAESGFCTHGFEVEICPAGCRST